MFPFIVTAALIAAVPAAPIQDCGPGKTAQQVAVAGNYHGSLKGLSSCDTALRIERRAGKTQINVGLGEVWRHKGSIERDGLLAIKYGRGKARVALIYPASAGEAK